MSHLLLLPDEVLSEVFSPRWLDLFEIVKVDTACCSKFFRRNLLEIFRVIQFQTRRSDIFFDSNALKWVVERKISVVNLSVNFKECEQNGNDIVEVMLKVDTSHIDGLFLSGERCHELHSFIIDFINSCDNVKYLNLWDCSNGFFSKLRTDILAQLEEIEVYTSNWDRHVLISDFRESVLRHCKSLVKIENVDNLCGDNHATQAEFQTLLRNNPNLKYISSLQIKDATEKLLMYFEIYCPDMEVLDRITLTFVQGNALSTITDTMVTLPNLKVVIIYSETDYQAYNKYTSSFEFVCPPEYETKRVLINVNVTSDALMTFFTTFDDFQEIVINQEYDFENILIKSNLLHVITVNNYHTLQILKLPECKSIFDISVFSELLQRCDLLETLEIHCCLLTDLQYYELFSIPTNLISFTMLICPHRISLRSTLCLLANSPKITHLHLDYCCKVTDKEDKISVILKSRGGEFVWDDDHPFQDGDGDYFVKYEYEEYGINE